MHCTSGGGGVCVGGVANPYDLANFFFSVVRSKGTYTALFKFLQLSNICLCIFVYLWVKVHCDVFKAHNPSHYVYIVEASEVNYALCC